eukprot:6090642-Pyramimonas_sp.AAC.1
MYVLLYPSTLLYSALCLPHSTLLYSALPYPNILCSTRPCFTLPSDTPFLLFSTHLSSITLYSALPYSALLYSTLSYPNILHSVWLLLYSIILYSTLLYSTLLYSTLLYSYSIMLFSTLLYSTLFKFYSGQFLLDSAHILFSARLDSTLMLYLTVPHQTLLDSTLPSTLLL